MPASSSNQNDLIIHVLNVGFGDNILIEFPVDENGKRNYGLVDCYNSKKTIDYIKKLNPNTTGKILFKFVCATHPHYDHIKGIKKILENKNYEIMEFWDCGFRHYSKTYRDILLTLQKSKIKMVRVSSGMEFYHNKVRISVLSPSVALRNRYATYGVDMNNASVVLRIEHHKDDVLYIKSKEYEGFESKEDIRKAGKSVVILAGDSEFDSWTHISQEYPKLEKTKEHKPLVKEMLNYLSCSLIKVSHHGSMHSAPLDIYEKMSPKTAIISTKQKISSKTIGNNILTRDLFPHDLTTIALEECGTKILTTDGSYESQKDNNGIKKDLSYAHEGSFIVNVPPGGNIKWNKYSDNTKNIP